MILVTGGAGFIGSNLCELLLDKGYKVLGVDSFHNNYDRWIKKFHIKPLLDNSNFIFLENNILDPSMEKLIEGLNIDYTIHLADIPGITTCSEINFDEYIRYNIISTQRLLEAIKNKGVKKFIYASSSNIYKPNNELPMVEIINPKPISLYGITKLAGENLSYYYGNTYNIDAISLRFPTTYGERQRPDMAFHKFIRNIILDKKINVYGNGNQKRNFIYVKDLCEIIINIIENDISKEIVNIEGTNVLSVNDSIQIIKEVLNKKAKINYIEPILEEQRITNNPVEKLNSIFSVDKKTDIYQGITKEVRFIRKLYGLTK